MISSEMEAGRRVKLQFLPPHIGEGDPSNSCRLERERPNSDPCAYEGGREQRPVGLSTGLQTLCWSQNQNLAVKQEFLITQQHPTFLGF